MKDHFLFNQTSETQYFLKNDKSHEVYLISSLYTLFENFLFKNGKFV